MFKFYKQLRSQHLHHLFYALNACLQTEIKLQPNAISEPVLLLEALLNEANDTAHSK